MNSIAHKLKHELFEFIPPAIFFFVAFHLLALTQSLMLKEYGIHISTFFAATIGALIVAKVVLLLDHVPIINRFPDKPLIYNVVWKTMLYFLAALFVRYLEHLIHFYRQTHDVAEAHRQLMEKVIWPHFWAVQMWLAVLLLIFCALRELSRALGRDRVRAMFFTSPRKAINLTVDRSPV